MFNIASYVLRIYLYIELKMYQNIILQNDSFGKAEAQKKKKPGNCKILKYMFRNRNLV